MKLWKMTESQHSKKQSAIMEKNIMFYTEFLFQQLKGMQLRVGQQQLW